MCLLVLVCDLSGVPLNCPIELSALIFTESKALTFIFCRILALPIQYKVDLDKEKGESVLRRLFFWDAAKQERMTVLENNYTIPARRTWSYLQPQTVYILVLYFCLCGNLNLACDVGE